MPAVKQNEIEIRTRVRRGVLERGLIIANRDAKYLAKRLCICVTSFYNKKKQPGEFTVEELNILAKETGMTDLEILEFVKGHQLTGGRA